MYHVRRTELFRSWDTVFFVSHVLAVSRPLTLCLGLAEGEEEEGEAVVSLILTFSLITV